MNVTINKMDGKTYKVNIDDSTTAEQLIKKVAEHEGVEAGQINLLHAGKPITPSS